MNSTSIPKRTDPNEMMIARLEKANARAYEQFADKVTHADGRPSNPVHDAADHPSDHPQTSVDKFRPAAAADRTRPGRPTRLFFGLLLIASVGVAILLWRVSHTDAVKQLIPGWESHSTPAQELAKPGFAAQTSGPAIHVDRAKVTPPPEDNAPTTAPQAAEPAQLLQTIARDLVTVVQGIEQFKTSQEQMARNNAKFAEQLRANQEQTARDNAKITEQLEAIQEQMARVFAKASKRNPRPVARTARPD
jgi:hypothetical protein